MQFKQGDGWKACYDEERGLYTAQRGGCGYYHLYEITEDIFNALTDGMNDADSYHLMDKGRHLYMDVNDRCGPPTPSYSMTTTESSAHGRTSLAAAATA